MPEAVIVATARSPIGRAHKGSLRELRPDDLATTIVDAALSKVPQLDRQQVGGLTVAAAQTLAHRRTSTAGRLRAQAEGCHYSTFSLYPAQELRAAIAAQAPPVAALAIVGAVSCGLLAEPGEHLF